MTKEEIENNFLELAKNDIQGVLIGSLDKFESKYVSFGFIKDYLQHLGFEVDSDSWSTNGWQVDYWVDFKSDVMGDYLVSGSLYYGTIKFYKKEE